MSKIKEITPANASGLVTNNVASGDLFSDRGYSTKVDERPWWSSVSLLLFMGIAAFIGWAAYFEIDQTVRATGQIIPTARNQIVQVADGGVLAKLLVQEGQAVEAGQRLAVLEKVRAKAGFEESKARVAALKIALMRAQAESNQEIPVYGPELDEFPDFVEAQLDLYNQRKRALDETTELLNYNLGIAEQQLEINERLLLNQDVSQLDVMNARAKVAEAKGKVVEVLNEYLGNSMEESAKYETDLAVANEQFKEQQNILLHTDILAPVAGVVKYLKMNTQGGVIRPGDELVEISPTNSELILEVKINPVDIGQLHYGLPVSIKLDAFDSSIYGNLDGELIYLSSDTLVEKGPGGRDETYYRAHVKVNEDAFTVNPKFAEAELRPGMTTSVDIRTAKRTVLHFLGKPVLRAFSGALSQR